MKKKLHHKLSKICKSKTQVMNLILRKLMKKSMYETSKKKKNWMSDISDALKICIWFSLNFQQNFKKFGKKENFA